MHSYLLLSRNAGLEVNADLGADHEGVGDVAGAAGPDDVLQAGLEEVRRVLEAEGVVPLKDRLLVRNRSHAQCDKKYSDIEAVAALRRTASAGRSGGRCDEWHLVLGNPFRHLAFHLGAGLGQPAVVVAPPLFHPRLITVGSVADPMAGDGIE